MLRFGHTLGCMHEGRLQRAQSALSLPPIAYMLAEGPPKSLRYPLKSGSWAMAFTSFRMLSLLRLTINLP